MSRLDEILATLSEKDRNELEDEMSSVSSESYSDGYGDGYSDGYSDGIESAQDYNDED